MKCYRVLILAVYLCTLQCDYSESCQYCGSKSFQIVLPPGANVIAQSNAASTSSLPNQNVPICNKCQSCQRSCCSCRQKPTPTTLSVPFYNCVPTTTNIVIQVQGSNNPAASNTITETTSTPDNDATSTNPTTDTVPATTDGTTSGTDIAANTGTDTDVTPNDTTSTDQATNTDTTTYSDPVSATDTSTTDPATETGTNTTEPATGTTNTDPSAGTDKSSNTPSRPKGRRVKSSRKRPTGSTATANSNSYSSTDQQEPNTDNTPSENNGDTTVNSRRRRSMPATSQKTIASAEASTDGTQSDQSNNAKPIKQTQNIDTNLRCTSEPQITITKYSDGSIDIDIVQHTEKPIDIGSDLQATIDFICIQTITIKNGTVNATSIDQNEIYVLEDVNYELITIAHNDSDISTYKWKYIIDDKNTVIIDRKYTLFTDYSDNWIYGQASSELEVTLFGPLESVASAKITSDTESEVDTTDLQFEDED
ncbi:hypothetical protein O0L34_g8247 [Tuta absoluta]|nr:hypothetical protein O0L34_g8247 [Tuta absoluta]